MKKHFARFRKKIMIYRVIPHTGFLYLKGAIYVYPIFAQCV